MARWSMIEGRRRGRGRHRRVRPARRESRNPGTFDGNQSVCAGHQVRACLAKRARQRTLELQVPVPYGGPLILWDGLIQIGVNE